MVRFEWDIVLCNSYDGWDKRGYTMWFPRKGNNKRAIIHFFLGTKHREQETY